MSTDTNDLGESDTTPEKLDVFRGLISMHLRICSRKPAFGTYQYIDMNAGPGRSPRYGVSGSPLIFLEEVRAVPHLRYQALFIELDPGRVLELQKAVGVYPGIRICHGSHCEALPAAVNRMREHATGVVYHDPKGIPSFEILAEVSRARQMRRMDFVLTFGATGIKRTNGRAQKFEQPYQTLIDSLSAIAKDTWLIREPMGRQQWTFLIGTNWPEFPVWGQGKFHDIKGPGGQHVIQKLTYQAERGSGYAEQLPLLPGISSASDVSGGACEGY